MLLRVLRTNLKGVQEATNSICLWTAKALNVHQYRPYHSCKKNNFLFVKAVQRHGRSFRLSRCSSSTIPKSKSVLKSEVLNDLETDEVDSSDSVIKSDDSSNFYKEHNISVKGGESVRPFFSIEDGNFPEYITKVLRRHNITTPTPIQAVTWPLLLNGRDFVGISPTGSGKTLAYGIPIVIRTKELILKSAPAELPSPFAVILTPTRELAQQILAVIRWFTSAQLKCVAAYGGVRKEFQLRDLRKGVDILIATPGRCNDLLEYDFISLNRCSCLVLDEADRMLDMGFLPQIEPIVESIPEGRQSLMWSATWPKDVRDIAQKFFSDYVEVTVGSTELKPNRNVKQTVVICSDRRDKLQKCDDLLSEILASPVSKILMFATTKFMVDELEARYMRKGFQIRAIHSGKSQAGRDRTLQSFRDGNIQVLIATAVAARGLDIDDVTHIVNFDCPENCEEYIHKIGRTGRMDKKGESITFVMDSDVGIDYLAEMLQSTGNEIPEELYQLTKSQKPQMPWKKQWTGYNSGRDKYGGFRHHPKYGSY